MASLGEELRAARESRRLSIPDVSEQIHIRSVYLQAIEEESWSSIAAPVYVRGFIRTYARFLGLDPEDVVTRFNSVVADSKPEPRPEPPVMRQRGGEPFPAWIWAACAAAVFLVFFVGYNYYRLQKSTQAAITAEAVAPPAPTPVRAQPAPARHAESANAQRGGKGFSVKLEQRSWLRVVLDGRDVMEGVFEPGTQRTFEGKTAVVRAGNAGGVTVAVDGGAAQALGPVGEVIERAFTSARK